MTDVELASLTYFRDGEHYLNGKPIDWTPINYLTMFWLDKIRQRLDSPITLIRGAHPNRPEAVDAFAPNVPLSRVFMELATTPKISFGIYAGNSFHIDTREYHYFPARWLAVHEGDAGLLRDRKLDGMITEKRDGWIYLAWHHARGFEALELVLSLAESKGARPAEGKKKFT